MKYLLIVLSILLMVSPYGFSRTKLTTLPERQKIRIDMKNKSYTLAEEERTINLQKGKNYIEFAWKNTHIDKSSIQFRNIHAPGRVKTININYPPNESALFWEVYSDKAGPGKFRISYIISNINKSISYEAIADKNERYMTLKTYFTLKNLTGEEFKNADIEINFGKNFKKSFKTGEAKKMLAAKFLQVPILKKYIYDNYVDKNNVRMYYNLRNQKKHKLGKFPLQPGKVRIYQEDSSGSEAFTGEDWGKYTPVGQTMDLYLGQAKEVKVKRYIYNKKERYTRKPVKDINMVIKYQVENFKKNTVPLILMEHPGGQWIVNKIILKKEIGERNKKREIEISHDRMILLKRKDVNNLEIKFNVPKTNNMKYNIYLYITLKNRW
ncbi:hypothetical protein ACFL20_04900 [Spirochaetota bacterium]